MRMKMFIFGCGMLSGMACLCLIPPVKEALMQEMEKASQKMQLTKKTLLRKGKQIKENIEDTASDISSDIKEMTNTIIDEIDDIDVKGMSSSLKKSIGKIKMHVVSLKNLVE